MRVLKLLGIAIVFTTLCQSPLCAQESPLPVAKDLQKYQREADQGNSTSQYLLGECFFRGIGVTKNFNEAAKWFLLSGRQNNALAQYKMGECFYYGKGVEKNFNKAFSCYRSSAEMGNAKAQNWLAECYQSGTGVETNYANALKWYRAAADQGYPQALYALGGIYLNGQLVPRDMNQAKYWLRKACKSDTTYESLIFQQVYDNLWCIDGDVIELFKQKALASGLEGLLFGAQYQHRLGLCYANGIGVETNYYEAVKWFTKASENGVCGSAFKLGVLYGNSESELLNLPESVKWFRVAANRGHDVSQYLVGRAYWIGEGVVKDPAVAYGWFLLAASNGQKDASQLLPRVEASLSADEQRKAREWAKKWKPGTDDSVAINKSLLPTPVQDDDKPTSSGSGFFITGDGYFITANHVVSGAKRIILNTTTGTSEARIVATDKVNDVAILKVSDPTSRPFTALTIPPRSKVTLGQNVFTVGFPNPTLQGVNPKLTKGEISALTGLKDDVRTYQVSIPVQSGNSGGVLSDTDGNVIGIIIMKLNALGVAMATGDVPQNVNYALKISYARPLVDSVTEIAESLPKEEPKPLSYENVIQKVQSASALVLSYGQKSE